MIPRTVSNTSRILLMSAVLSALAASLTPGLAQTATFTGNWTNTTFSTTGAASVTGQVQGNQITLTFDLDGGVFGGTDPAPVTLNGTVGPGSIIFSKMGDSFYGDMTIEFGFDGSVKIVFDKVPASGIDRLEANGSISTTPLRVDYTVFFTAGGTAVGNVQGNQTSGVTPERLFFAHVGNGTGVVSDIVIPNPNQSATATGVISFADDDGNAQPTGIAQMSTPQSTVNFTIPPLGSVTVSTDGMGTVAAGSAAIISDVPLGGIIRFGLTGFGVAGVGSSEPLSAFIIPVRRTAGGINTGVALRNASHSAMITAALSLRDSTGTEKATASQDLMPDGHLAMFIDQLFPNADTSNFVGTLVVTITGGKAVGTALELGTKAGEFTTLPVTAIQ